jgi:predicted nucleic acid-binding protein
LLDTNIVITVLKRRTLEVLTKCNANAANPMAISSMTISELMHSAEKSQFKNWIA